MDGSKTGARVVTIVEPQPALAGVRPSSSKVKGPPRRASSGLPYSAAVRVLGGINRKPSFTAGKPAARRVPAWLGGRTAMLLISGFLILALVVASLVGWYITYSAGVGSVKTVGEHLQELYPPQVMKEVQLRMEPARVHVQQGLELLHLKGLDPTSWEAYEAIRAHGVSFLLNYFDDAQCCYGFFTRMSYTPGVNEDNFGDNRALFDSVIASREYDPATNTTITSLANLRPGNTSGSATNEAYWVPFNMTDRKLPRPLVLEDYANLGFIHFPRDDGVNPQNPNSGWWRVITSRDMQEGDFCFSPIFVWKVNEPVTLKIHAIVPVWNPPGIGISDPAAKERVGAYVVGFKLHFLIKYLQESSVDMPGQKTFMVERDTGFIIASSNATMPLMDEAQETIHSHNVSDEFVRSLALFLAPDGDWMAVPTSEHYDTVVNGIPTMIFLDSYRQYCLEWVVVVAVPRQAVLEGISSHRISTIIASVSAPIAMIIALVLLLLFTPLVIRQLKKAKANTKKSGPPRAGEKVTILITDIQGSTTLWDSFPDELAKDIAIHHQCLRAELKNYRGFELLTEGDSMHIAFHTPEDAVCFCIQVQLNLLCAPWTSVLEDGGSSILCGEASWPSPKAPMLDKHHQATIRDLPFNGAFNCNEHSSTANATSTAAPLFSVQSAAETELSRSATREMPQLTVRHKSSNRPLPVFRGLRVRMGIHSGVASDSSTSLRTGQTPRYDSKLMEMAKAVSDLPCGGQIVMTGDTLAEMQSMHELLARVNKQCEGWSSGLKPSQHYGPEPELAAVSVMHLGTHVLIKPEGSTHSSSPNPVWVGVTEDVSVDLGEALSPGGEEQLRTNGTTPPTSEQRRTVSARCSQDVFAVVPWPIRARAMFCPPISSKEEITPAWHGSPSSADVTILFTFVENWMHLKRWERDTPSAEGTLAHSRELHDSLVRTLLLENNGYEVEGEDGCFVCAFKLAVEAIDFSVALQEALLKADWDPLLLTTPWACEQYMASGPCLNRGLRVAVGMCTGNARRYQPSLRTGRMEYFGPLMNHAARVAVAAHGGQVLVHSNCLASITASNPQVLDVMAASLHSMGTHKLKGVASPVEIFQVSSPALEGRVFPPIKTSTTKVMQADENADPIFRYGIDHVTCPGSKMQSFDLSKNSLSLSSNRSFASDLTAA